MQNERIKRTFALAYLATGIAQVSEIGYNFFLYKSFSPDEIGLFAWAAAIIVFFNMAVDLGVEPILTRKFAKDPLSTRRAMEATFLPRVPIVLIGAAAATVLYSLEIIGVSKYWMLLLIGGQAIFNISDGVCKAWLRANGRQNRANCLAAAIGVLKLAAIIALTWSGSASLFQLLAYLLAIRAAVSLWAYQSTAGSKSQDSHDKGQPLLSLSGSLLKAGFVVGGISVLTAVQSRFDWLLVSYFISPAALASYSLANKFYEISQVLVGAALTTIYPWLCRTDVNRTTVFIVMRLVIAAGVIFAATGAILGPSLIEILFDGKYPGTSVPVMVLMLAVGVMAACGVFYQLLLSRGQERSLLFVTVFTTLIQAMFNVWAIPRLGTTGAALGMLLLVVLTAIGLSTLVWKRGLLGSLVVIRILTFLAIFLVSTYLIVNSVSSIGFSVLCNVILLVVTAWWLLFDIAERDILRRQLAALLRH